MTLRQKILLIVGATLVSLNFVLYAASSTIVVNRFNKLERERVHQNIERVLDALANEHNQLNTIAGDWAPWDETYTFIADGNERYIKANLDNLTFANLRIDLMFFFNARGELVFGKGFNLKNHRAEPISPKVLESIRNSPVLLNHRNEKNCYSGIILLPPAQNSPTTSGQEIALPLMLAACPILTNEHKGPMRGTLLVGRYLDNLQIQQLSQQLGLAIKVRPLKNQTAQPQKSSIVCSASFPLRGVQSSTPSQPLPAIEDSCEKPYTVATPIPIESLSSEAIAGNAELRDLYGNPALMLRVELPRDIYKQGQASLRYITWSLLISGGIFGVVSLVILEKLILSRLASLTEGVRAIASSQNLSQHLSIPGSDELSSLAESINGMLSQLEGSQMALRESEAKFRAVSEATPIPVVITRASDGQALYVNEYTALTFGVTRADLMSHKTSEFYYDLNERQALLRSFLEKGHLRNYEVRAKKADGTPFWVCASLQGLMFNGEAAILSAFFDISDRKQMEQALFQEKELAQVTLQSIADGVITTDARGQVQSLNPVAETLTGWRTEEAKGRSLTEVLQLINEMTHAPVENPVRTVFREKRIVGTSANIALIARDGREFAIDHSAAPIYASSGQIMGAVLVFRNVTQARHLARQLTWQATHDRLTRLINRHEFERLLESAVGSAETLNQQHILCYLDLDRFKVVNDTCGHAAGDELLRQVTVLWKRKLRSGDILARLGGDEFGLLMYRCSMEEAIQMAETLREQIQNFRFVWREKTFTIGVSIGLVTIEPCDPEVSGPLWTANVLSAADAACYSAKSKGHNRLHIYKADDSEMARQFLESQWVGRIHHALEENRFRLYYQIIAPLGKDKRRDLKSTTPPLTEMHCEVLLRMVDEAGELVSPGCFIAAAERYNLMPGIDRWVIEALFSSLANYGFRTPHPSRNGQSKSKHSQAVYSVNLSGASINDDEFIDFLRSQFEKYQIPPQIVCFEITETVAIANLSKAVQFIHDLKQFGCQFALDDFGSGMCSFAYLKNLPVDYLKIDGYFVKDIADDPIASAMVEAINRIGHVMGIETVAEFVANERILEKLRQIGVNYAQGYYINKPQPLPIDEYPISKVKNEFKTVR